MTDGERPKKQFSTCLEEAPFAEALRKVLDRRGVGSLSAEMMKRVIEKHGRTKTTKEEDDVDEE